MPRPTKLTPERQKAICDDLRTGCYVETACVRAGIDESTFYRWLEKARSGRRPYSDFRDAVKKAEADAEVLLAGTVMRVALNPENPNWQAAMTMLERRHPERWGRRVAVAGEGGGPLQVQVVQFGEEDHGAGKGEESEAGPQGD